MCKVTACWHTLVLRLLIYSSSLSSHWRWGRVLHTVHTVRYFTRYVQVSFEDSRCIARSIWKEWTTHHLLFLIHLPLLSQVFVRTEDRNDWSFAAMTCSRRLTKASARQLSSTRCEWNININFASYICCWHDLSVIVLRPGDDQAAIHCSCVGFRVPSPSNSHE